MRGWSLVAAVACALIVTGSIERADSHTLWKHQPGIRVIHATDHQRRDTWACQRELGRQPTRTVYSERRSPSTAYRRWVRDLWRNRARFWCGTLNQARNANRDWRRAVDYAGRVFPGSAGWLWACSSSEGGHGPWVPNRAGSGAGGWMQFLHGTFYRNVDRAARETRGRGFVWLPAWRSWYSPAGQALTGASMLAHGQRGEWFGPSC